MTEGTERQLLLRARELAACGADDVEPLPDPDELAGEDENRRHQVLQGLRLELHAISSVLADAAVARALDERPSYPPYGLVRSGHSETRMLISDPKAVEEGSIPGFLELGKALVDTNVFHLDREFHEYRHSERAWMIQRLEDLLTLFRIGAGPLTKSRMRDGLSFIYGGLHFGTGVCVQLAEVMSRLLAAFPEAAPDERAAVMGRSIRPAYRLAALNIDHVIFAYKNLQAPAAGPTTWMRDDAFVVQTSGDRPWRIDLVEQDLLGPRPISVTYETLGCPARTSPSGGASAIADLWGWTVELAHELGLICPDRPR
ncbi:MAG TPA: hypothetical protein VK988_03995 [Acidimicrobiales bacterium]|nr:hypothetical protein [Acidimicrobiales bacterium]